MLQVREILTATIDKKNDAEDADPKSQYKDIPSKSTGRFDSDLFQCRTVAEAISVLRVMKFKITELHRITYLRIMCQSSICYLSN